MSLDYNIMLMCIQHHKYAPSLYLCRDQFSTTQTQYDELLNLLQFLTHQADYRFEFIFTTHTHILSNIWDKNRGPTKISPSVTPKGDSTRYVLLTVNHRQGAKNIDNDRKSVRKFEHAVQKYNFKRETYTCNKFNWDRIHINF